MKLVPNPLTLAVLCALPLLAHAQDNNTLKTIEVQGTRTTEVRDQAGYDAIYESNYSSDFAGSQRINTYRGTNPSDLLKNFTGVYSGEARNGGAIDPNVRGIQGPGRVPVTVDGTKQAMTVSRGYNGASNRNYIDPMLIGGMRVVKDGGIIDDINMETSIGGGIAIRTIDADDILQGKKGFGGEIKVESSSNSAKFENVTNYHGWLEKDIPLQVDGCEGGIHCAYAQQMPIKSSGNGFNFLSGRDAAGRVALAYGGDNWSILGAYAYRQRGNYYAGKNNASYYDKATNDESVSAWDKSRSMTSIFAPGSEVANTAMRTQSYLFKVKANPTEAQSIEAGYMRTESLFGEILPVQMILNMNKRRVNVPGVVDQIPLSSFNANSYYLNYALKPKDNKWVDLKLGLWRTDSDGVQENRPFTSFISSDPDNEKRLDDKAKTKFKDTRYGFKASNTFHVTPKVDVSLFGSMEHRTFNAESYNHPVNSRWGIFPQKGRTTVSGGGFNLQFRPTNRLTVDVGAKYTSYRLHDDGFQFMKESRALGTVLGMKEDGTYDMPVGYKYTKVALEPAYDKKVPAYATYEAFSQSGDAYKAFREEVVDEFNRYQYFTFSGDYKAMRAAQQQKEKYSFSKEVRGDVFSYSIDFGSSPLSAADARSELNKQLEKFIWERSEYNNDITITVPAKEVFDDDNPIEVMPRADGKYYFADHPCYNGTFNEEEIKKYCVGSGQITLGSKTVYEGEEVKTVKLQPITLKKGHKWTPSLGISYQLTDSARIYARYNESVRYPDLVENTVMFAGVTSVARELPTVYKELKPEHSHLFEIGYVQDLRGLFANAEIADFKVAYYHNRIDNVIDRTGALSFENLDKQTIEGLEFTGRYDNGRFFADVGVNYTLKNEVCDESLAVRQSILLSGGTKLARLPSCMQNGFPWGFLVTQSTPKLSTTLNMGVRLLDRDLELGGRMTYYTKYKNKNYDKAMQYAAPGTDYTRSNVAYGWGNTMVFDAYAKYKINKNFDVELSASNITDQYYLDPAGRSLMPAPGRTVKLSITGRF